jgi:hypothetical protein
MSGLVWNPTVQCRVHNSLHYLDFLCVIRHLLIILSIGAVHLRYSQRRQKANLESCLPLDSVLSQMNPVHIFPKYFIKPPFYSCVTHKPLDSSAGIVNGTRAGRRGLYYRQGFCLPTRLSWFQTPPYFPVSTTGSFPERDADNSHRFPHVFMAWWLIKRMDHFTCNLRTNWFTWEARGSVVGWGTVPRAGMSRDRVAMRWIFLVYIILPAPLWPWGWLSL